MTRRGLLGLLGLLVSAEAAATPCTVAGATWCEDTGSATTLEAPGGLSALGLDRVVVPKGSALLSIDVSSGAVTSGPSLGATITSRPMPVLFGASEVAVFVGTSNGYVYRLDPSTGACVWKTYVGRTASAGVSLTPGCLGTVTPATGTADAVYSTPALRLGATAADSTVYVGTRYSGGQQPDRRNRVYALNAATGAPRFVFNAPGVNDYRDRAGARSVDFVSSVFPDTWADGCDPAGNRDRILFGTDANGSDTGYSLAALTGTIAAFGDIGAVWAMPVLSYNPARCGRVYVGTQGGQLSSLGLTTTSCGGTAPCLHWSTSSGAVTLDLAVAQFGAGLGLIYVTTGGRVRAYRDNGSSATLACTYTPSGGRTAATAPLYAGDKVYVGLSGGAVAQFDATTCGGEVVKIVDVIAATVGDATIDVDGSWTRKYLVVGTSTGRVVRLDLPW